jgi:hypothetical protein
VSIVSQRRRDAFEAGRLMGERVVLRRVNELLEILRCDYSVDIQSFKKEIGLDDEVRS